MTGRVLFQEENVCLCTKDIPRFSWAVLEDICMSAAFSQQDEENWKELNHNRTPNKLTLKSKFHLFQTKNLLKHSLGTKILILLPVYIQTSIFIFSGLQVILQLVFLMRNGVTKGTVLYQLFYTMSGIMVTHSWPKNSPLDSQLDRSWNFITTFIPKSTFYGERVIIKLCLEQIVDRNQKQRLTQISCCQCTSSLDII